MKFELSKKQMIKLKEWQEAIKTVYGEYGNYTYCFTPNGLGESVEVICDFVGDEWPLNLTDVDSW